MTTTMQRLAQAGLVAALAACAVPAPVPEEAAPSRAPAPPLPPSGVALANFDREVRPQDDFYRHVNGTWLKTTQIPADKPQYGAFTKLVDDSELRMRAIIEEAAATPNKLPGSDEQKVGDFYASFMNEAYIEQLGLKPLEAELARIQALKAKKDIAPLMARLSRIGVRSPLALGVLQDEKNATEYIVYVQQSGLGLPDRDYYLIDDAKFKDIRVRYLAHVEAMLKLAGDKAATKNAKDIVALETAIAKAHWSRVDSRDRDKTYNKFELAKLATLAPTFGWSAYVKDAGIRTPAVVVQQPSAVSGFGKLLANRPLPVWKAYFRWRVLSAYAPYLSKAFVDENFAFYGAVLRGIQENRPRWKRGVEAVHGGLDGQSPFASKGLGEVLGRIYVARHFPPEAKTRMEQLVKNLLKAYEQSIGSLEWMSPETRQRALEKLSKFTYKIGYPNKWRDYSTVRIDAADLVGNIVRGAEFDYAFEFDKLGRPVDRDEWHMTPQIVNAYYNPTMNEIVFPAAILQPPFFDKDADDAVNYGGIGAVIGHEIGHGFDDQGSKYDGDGNLKSWWTEDDRRKFEERTRALIDQYSAYEPIPGYKVNGALTIGENIGDLGGAGIALKAYRIALGGKPGPVLDGFTGEQRFFVGYAQVWASLRREPLELERLKSDSHSPPQFRCNGALSNVDEFYTAFNVRETDRMYLPPGKRVKIW
jgi:predicted metalloendopeptidase